MCQIFKSNHPCVYCNLSNSFIIPNYWSLNTKETQCPKLDFCELKSLAIWHSFWVPFKNGLIFNFVILKFWSFFPKKYLKIIEFTLEKHKFPKITWFHPKEKKRKLFRVPNLTISLAKISFFFFTSLFHNPWIFLHIFQTNITTLVYIVSTYR